MPKLPKVILFDVDGVLIITPKWYSRMHAEEFDIEDDRIENFFHGVYKQATTGKADLKQLLEQHREVWAWKGTPEELMDRWFKAQSNLDQDLMGIIQKLRGAGAKVYLATDQEKYRAAYLHDQVIGDTLDGEFVSCEIGLAKRNPEFFEIVLARLAEIIPDLEPADVTFFDDSHHNVDSAGSTGINAIRYIDRSQVANLVPVAIRRH